LIDVSKLLEKMKIFKFIDLYKINELIEDIFSSCHFLTWHILNEETANIFRKLTFSPKNLMVFDTYVTIHRCRFR